MPFVFLPQHFMLFNKKCYVIEPYMFFALSLCIKSQNGAYKITYIGVAQNCI